MSNLIKSIWNTLHYRQFIMWIVILAILLGIEIVATVAIPIMRDYLYEGIQSKNMELFIVGLWYFAGVIGTFCLCQGFKYYVGHRVGLIIRNAITKVLKIKWVSNLNKNAQFDNPDQRISEDARLATESAIEVFIEVLISVSIIIGLVIQMWGVWFLMGMAFGYTLLATIIVLFFHRPMINAEKSLQRSEADFRFNLASISLHKKDKSTKLYYANVIERYLRFTYVLMGFTLFNKIKGNLMSIVPFLILVPMFFADEITFGGVMKGVAQFDLIVVNATILILLYPKFTKAVASWERIDEFYRGLK